MKTIIVTVLVLALPGLSVSANAQTQQARWANSRVMLLPGQCEFRVGGQKVSNAAAQFLGKEAVIRSFAPKVKGGLVVSVDGIAKPIEISLGGVTVGYLPQYCAAAIDEYRAAAQLVGRSLWSNGPRSIPAFESVPPGIRILSGTAVALMPATMVKIVAVSYQVGGDGIAFILEVPDGKRGAWYPGGTQYAPNATTQDVVNAITNNKYRASRFLIEDPQAAHPDWEERLWDQIRNGTPTVGMTMDMVEMTCGERPSKQQVVIQSTDAGTSTFDQMICVGSANRVFRFLALSGRIARMLE